MLLFLSLPNSQRKTLSGGEENFASPLQVPGSSRQGARREKSVRACVCREGGKRNEGAEKCFHSLEPSEALAGEDRRTCGKRTRGVAGASRGEPVPPLLFARQRAGKRKNSGIVIPGACPEPRLHIPLDPPPPQAPCLPTPRELMNVRPVFLANGEARRWLAGPRALSELLPAGIGRSPKFCWKEDWNGLIHGEEYPTKIASFNIVALPVHWQASNSLPN